MSNNEISRIPQNGELSVYQKIANPMEAVESLGKSLAQAGMASNPGEGVILALACLYENQNPLQFLRENMIVMGKPVRKYQLLLVDLRQAGGNYKWIKDGEDAKEATIEITWKGESYRYTFSMDMAKRAGLLKNDSGWAKWPGNMLRSKCVRQAFDMYCPEITAGYVTPEDAEEMGPSYPQRQLDPPPIRETSAPKETSTPAAKTEAQASNRKTETEKEMNGSQAAESEVTPEMLAQLIGKARQIPTQNGQLTEEQVRAHICKSAGIDKPEDLTRERWQEMLDKVNEKLQSLTEAATSGN